MNPCRTAAVLVLVMPMYLGCATTPSWMTGEPVPANPAQRAAELPAPPTDVGATARPKVELPANWQELAKELSLTDIVGIALANNDDTRAAWFAARAAAARVGQKRADYLPSVDLTADVAANQGSAVGGRFSFRQGVLEPGIDLNWLVFDFGGRPARVAEAKATLVAADWQHDAAIQNVVLQVEQAYFQYLGARAQLKALEATVKEAETNLDAATRRKEVGVATVADVLQAKTALSQARLQYQTVAGRIDTLRGGLATAMGIPATTDFDVGELPAQLPAVEVAGKVEDLIDRALVNRPDLAALRWQAEQSARHVSTIRAEGRPSISLSSSANRAYYWAPQEISGARANNWSAAVGLRFPLFTGYDHSFKVQEAEANAVVSQAQAHSYEQQVILDVWSTFSDLKTAQQRLATARDLLASADESNRVALARYKEGVGSILDLLTTQASLALARSQDIQARSDWLLALANLAHATGFLDSPSATLKVFADSLTTEPTEKQKP